VDASLESWHWLVFGALVVVLLVLDLVVFQRHGRARGMRWAVIESILWIAVGLGFTGFVWWIGGSTTALEYLTAYLVEKSLSADNLFVFTAIFEYFRVRQEHQHRVLFLGIVGAVILRGIFIFAGLKLLEALDWVVYIFGAILIWTGIRLGLKAFKHQKEEAGPNAFVRLAERVLPLDREHQGKEFWYWSKTGLRFTPMALVLIAIESTDVIFAIDSVPAVLAITRDQFVAYSSNVFAILGLRALYFVLVRAINNLVLIRPTLAAILVLVGIKMLISHVVELPVWVWLIAVGTLLGLGIGGSLLLRRWGKTEEDIGFA
jgi:tellurite resistance protein TerC